MRRKPIFEPIRERYLSFSLGILYQVIFKRFYVTTNNAGWVDDEGLSTMRSPALPLLLDMLVGYTLVISEFTVDRVLLINNVMQ